MEQSAAAWSRGINGSIPKYNPDGSPVGHGNDVPFDDIDERQPLLDDGKRPGAQYTSPAHRFLLRVQGAAVQLAPSVGLAWCAFLLASLITTFVYHWARQRRCSAMSGIACEGERKRQGVAPSWLVYTLVGVVYLLAAFGTASTYVATGGVSIRMLTLLMCCVAIVAGFIAGYYNYVVYARDYWAYDERRRYANVLPVDLAAAHADASVIRFESGSKPDIRRVGQYGAGRRAYCVAPITQALDQDTSSMGNGVQFWAVGRGCCSGGTFKCGAVDDASAQSGWVMRNRTNIFTGLIGNDMVYYAEAIEMACAKYGMKSAAAPLLMYWVKDPAWARSVHLRRAWVFWLKAGLLSSLGWVIMGIAATAFIHHQAGPSRRKRLPY